jgi:hypothetical protein
VHGGKPFANLLAEAIRDSGIYGHHLRRHWKTLSHSPELAESMKKVVMAAEPIMLNSDVKFKLDSLGLVKFQGDGVVPRCQLYQTYFAQTL